MMSATATKERPATAEAPPTVKVVIKPSLWSRLKSGVGKLGRKMKSWFKAGGRTIKAAARRTKPVAKAAGRVATRVAGTALFVPTFAARWLLGAFYLVAPTIGMGFCLAVLARYGMILTGTDLPLWACILIAAAVLVGATYAYEPLRRYVGFAARRTVETTVAAAETVAEAVAQDTMDIEVEVPVKRAKGTYDWETYEGPDKWRVEETEEELRARIPGLNPDYIPDPQHDVVDARGERRRTVAEEDVTDIEEHEYLTKPRTRLADPISGGPISMREELAFRKLTDREESILREGRFNMARDIIADLETYDLDYSWDVDNEGVVSIYKATVSDGVFNVVMTDKLDADWKIEMLARAFEALTIDRDAGPAQRGYSKGRAQGLDAYLRERSALFEDPMRAFNQTWLVIRKQSGAYPHNTYLKGFLDSVEELKDVYAPEQKKRERDELDAIETERLRNAPA